MNKLTKQELIKRVSSNTSLWKFCFLTCFYILSTKLCYAFNNTFFEIVFALEALVCFLCMIKISKLQNIIISDKYLLYLSYIKKTGNRVMVGEFHCDKNSDIENLQDGQKVWVFAYKNKIPFFIIPEDVDVSEFIISK